MSVRGFRRAYDAYHHLLALGFTRAEMRWLDRVWERAARRAS
jgi:hypothetical protein